MVHMEHGGDRRSDQTANLHFVSQAEASTAATAARPCVSGQESMISPWVALRGPMAIVGCRTDSPMILTGYGHMVGHIDPAQGNDQGRGPVVGRVFGLAAQMNAYADGHLALLRHSPDMPPRTRG